MTQETSPDGHNAELEGSSGRALARELEGVREQHEISEEAGYEFDAGPVVITHLSTSLQGFEVETHESIGRTAASDNPVRLDDDQRQRLAAAYQGMPRYNALERSRAAIAELDAAKEAGRSDYELAALKAAHDAAKEDRRNAPIGGEIKFGADPEHDEEHKNAVAAAREALTLAKRERRGEETIAALEANLKDASELWRNTLASRGKKIGLRHIEVNGNTITAEVQSVPFPVYAQLSRPDSTPEVLSMSRIVGAAMIVETSDGRLIVQHRSSSKQRLHEPKMSQGNASYGDIPGASVAGVVDATGHSEGRIPGTPDSINKDTIKAQIFKEAGEELGLAPEDLEEVRIVGLAEDAIKPHDEFLLLGRTSMSAERVRQVSQESKRNKNLSDADFEERFFDIEASPEAIEVLLTQVQCPLPPTHAAALVAAGYALELTRGSEARANEWKQRMEDGVRANYARINDRVAAHYVKYPEVLTQVPERNWGKRVSPRNPDAYDPAYTPEEQGLPGLNEELIGKHLIGENRRSVDDAYLFDVDGVLTNPLEKRVPDEVFGRIIEKLEQGTPVGLNTGRSTEWVKDQVITSLLERVEDPALLANLVLIGEKGGTWTYFDEQGNMLDGKVKSITVPDDLYKSTSDLIQEKYADIMHVDLTKQTMISIEINDGFTDLEAFGEAQRDLVAELEGILAVTGKQNLYNIDPTTIATDIESPYVGKALGADRFLQWLQDENINPATYQTFGDSTSDLDMADELTRRGRNAKFIFVGDPTKVAGLAKGYEIETSEGYDQGTIRYMNRGPA